ncbi:hypothetical protein GCM10009737_12020 [Nocardioides lentus]|uniref:Halobacterial output domain-containing protein n=1 Tax=Nocardioides lentus TaxID=338077 RepID=A0ABP5AG29_9ACTN
MSEPVTPSTPDDDPRVEALQAAVDRVVSYEESAPAETVRAELDGAVAQAGLDVPDDVLARLTQHISDHGEHVDVRDFLG